MKKCNETVYSSVIFYADVPFQIMMAIHLTRTELKGCAVDIIISDHINDCGKILKNIKNVAIFRNVFFMEAYTIDKAQRGIGGRFKRVKNIICGRKIIEKILEKTVDGKNAKTDNKGKHYDAFFVTDILPSTAMLYDYLIFRNPEAELIFYEESPVAVLCDQNNMFITKKQAEKANGRFERIVGILEKFLGHHIMYGDFKGGYTSIGDLIKDKYYFPFKAIPKLELGDIEYRAILNQLWEYTEKEADSNKVILFEEAFYIDGRESNDMKMITDVIEMIGKEHLLIKLHPRTRENRFVKLGIETTQDTSIPWELAALNNKGNQPILVAFASGALIHPQLYWGIGQRAISLICCKEYHFELLDNKYYSEYKNICMNKNLVFLPENREEFLNMVKRELNLT